MRGLLALSMVCLATAAQAEPYSAAICFFQRGAATARAKRVIQTSGNTAVSTSYTKAEVATWHAKRAAELRRKARAEGVTLVPCGSAEVKKMLSCVRGEDCDAGADDVDAVRDLIDGE